MAEKFKVLDFKVNDPGIARTLGCAMGDSFKLPVWDEDGVKDEDARVPLVSRVTITDLGVQQGERFGALPAKAISYLRRKPAICEVFGGALDVLPKDSPLRSATGSIDAPPAPVEGDGEVDPDEDPNVLAAAIAAGAPVKRQGSRGGR